MSREIKFRAWDKKRKRYAKVIQTTNQGWKGYRDKTYITNGIMCFSKWVLSRFIIEQYTGLKDKNGKEIYEGDIVRTTDRVTVKDLIFPIGVVEFKQQAFWICNVPSGRPDFTHNETLLKYWETDLEVIGNIHEDPELLGGEE